MRDALAQRISELEIQTKELETALLETSEKETAEAQEKEKIKEYLTQKESEWSELQERAEYLKRVHDQLSSLAEKLRQTKETNQTCDWKKRFKAKEDECSALIFREKNLKQILVEANIENVDLLVDHEELQKKYDKLLAKGTNSEVGLESQVNFCKCWTFRI